MNKRDAEFLAIIQEAEAAGQIAGEQKTPAPMIVSQHESPLNDKSPVVQQWFEAEGACGFAWVNLKPGNSPLANYLKKNGKARPDEYYGGVTVWVSGFNQSVARKEAYAEAYAGVLKKHGFKAYAASRLD